MGVQEWSIVIAVIVIVAVLLWLAARWRRRRYDEIYSQDPTEERTDLVSEYGSELPSGGARTVGYRDAGDIERMHMQIKERAHQQKPKLSSMTAPGEQQTLFANPEDEAPHQKQTKKRAEVQVPLLLDPSEEHSETALEEPASAPQPAPQPEIESEVEAETAAKESRISESEMGEESVMEESEIEEAVIEQPAIEDRPKQEKPAESSKKKASEKKTKKKKDAVEDNANQDPPEVVIVNLMTSPESAYQGQSLMRALTESGMRFGEMDIFHYFGAQGNDTPLFRMANLLNPGVFDVSDMDNFGTHGLCFFFELEPDNDNMAIYESMLSVINALKEELGGEIRDDQRSVFTIQTSEHCKNRIRDFQRRHLVKRR